MTEHGGPGLKNKAKRVSRGKLPVAARGLPGLSWILVLDKEWWLATSCALARGTAIQIKACQDVCAFCLSSFCTHKKLSSTLKAVRGM